MKKFTNWIKTNKVKIIAILVLVIAVATGTFYYCYENQGLDMSVSIGISCIAALAAGGIIPISSFVSNLIFDTYEEKETYKIIFKNN